MPRNEDFFVIGRTNAVRASTMDDALRRGETLATNPDRSGVGCGH